MSVRPEMPTIWPNKYIFIGITIQVQINRNMMAPILTFNNYIIL